jgi:hypothetical protein
VLPNRLPRRKGDCGGTLIILVRFLVGANMMRLGWAFAIGIYASSGTLFWCYKMWRAIVVVKACRAVNSVVASKHGLALN